MTMEGCELLEIKNPSWQTPTASNITEESIDAGFGQILVAQQGARHVPNTNRHCIVTFHDIGLNYLSNFQAFFNYHLMRPVGSRLPIFHINAPGQEDDAEDLPNDYEYPTMAQLAESVRTVCNYYGIKQAILFGVGLGANVMTRVALDHPDLVDALFVINPIPSSAGWYEWAYQKKNIYYLYNLNSGIMGASNDGYKSMNYPQSLIDYMVWYHFGTPSEQRNSDLVNMYKSYFSSCKIRPKNLAMLIDSYLRRDDIGVRRESGHEINCSTFIICGNDSPFLEDSIDMNQRLRSDKSGWMKIFDCGMALDEQPQKVSEAFILFLQGLGYGLLTNYRIK